MKKQTAAVGDELDDLFALLAECERALKGTSPPLPARRTAARKKKPPEKRPRAAATSKKRPRKASKSTAKRVAARAPSKRKRLGANVVYPNISRIDYAKTHGYQVRFQRKIKTGKGRRVIGKLFSDGVYGGAPAALAAAIAWRNETAKNVPPGQRSPSMGYPNPPGYSYIKRSVSYDYSRGVRREYMAYVGFLRIEEGRHLTTRWSIGKWGDKVAKRRCEEWLSGKKIELELRLGKRSSQSVSVAHSMPGTSRRALTSDSSQTHSGTA